MDIIVYCICYYVLIVMKMSIIFTVAKIEARISMSDGGYLKALTAMRMMRLKSEMISMIGA